MTKFSEALARVHKSSLNHVVRSKDISRKDREALIHGKWLQPIVRGWYLLVRPDVPPGETSPWYASFWDFLGLYLQDLYGDQYCLSAENSLDLHVSSTIVPSQVIAISEKGNHTPLGLPFNTSLLTYRDTSNLPRECVKIRGVRVMNLPLALCRVSPLYFTKNAKDAEIALRLVKDPTDLVRVILQHDFKRSANRIVGAYQFFQEPLIATQIRESLERENFYIQPENPFKEEKPLLSMRVESPYAARIFALWSSMRQTVIDLFPKEENPLNQELYFAELEKIYAQDAYNSLSIEGYRVDDALIQKVMLDEWNPDGDLKDRSSKDALAALGYYQAFQKVLEAIRSVFQGESSALVAEKNLQQWMRSLFQPLVDVKVLKPEDLVGYRRNQVYIRGSRHIPLPREALLDAMQAFYTCLKEEPHPAVRAVVGHFVLVYIHPYMDGNGRSARFLMNVMFASGGYRWVIIRMKNRDRYFAALESASVQGDIAPLARFIHEEMH